MPKYTKSFSRNTKIIALMGVFALSLAACGSSDESSAPAGEADTDLSASISFSATFPEDAVNPAIDAFNEEYPDIQVTYEELPFNDLNDVIQTRVGSGDSTPDVYAADQPRIAGLVDDELLLDISADYEDADDLFDPSTVEVSTVDDTLYAAPVNTSSVVLYYNEELLEAGDVELPSKNPEDRMTWEALRDAAEATQDAGAKHGFQIFRVGQIFQMQPLPESLGGGSGMNTETDPHQPELTNDAWIESMQFFQDLHEDGISPRGISVEEVPELFASGDLAFFLGTTAHHDTWANDLDFDYGIAPHPYFEDGEPVTPTGAWSLGVNPSTENEEAARAFVRFVTATQEGSQAWADGVGNIPANVETQQVYFENELYSDDEDYSTADLITHELNNTAVNRARTPRFIEFETVMGNAFEDIRNGQDVENTLENAEESLTGSRGRN